MSAKNQYTKMISRDGKIVGEIKNLHSRPCPMAGCKGHRMLVLITAYVRKDG